PAFKACVQEGGAYSVMGAYNRTNGEPCCGSKTLLQEILRDEWGFEGFVVSDCWAIRDFHQTHQVTSSPAESAAMAVKNGCELNCGDMYPNLLQAVEQDLITEAEIDVAVKRLFKARFKLGMFDPDDQVAFSSIHTDMVNGEKHIGLARRMAQQSMVLLKNNGILPLKKDLAKISVIGPNAMNQDALVANYNGYASNMATVVEGVVDTVSVGTQVFVAKGCELQQGGVNEAEISWGFLEPNDAIIAVLGNTSAVEGEEPDEAASDGGGDRQSIQLPGAQLDLLKHLREIEPAAPLILVVLSGSPVDLSWAVGHCDAILYGWYPGEQGGNAIADVLFGDYNPAGRLPVTFVKSLGQLPDFSNYDMAGRTYRFMTGEPQFPFGYGLSYTQFEYSDLKVEGFNPAQVSVKVSNIGKRDGDEVVQVYVKDLEASVPVAVHQLKAFCRIHLKAGESRRAAFDLWPDQFEVYGDDGVAFLESGEFEISVGGGQPHDKSGGAVSDMIEVGE
ncbi:MAG: glycoside hydrolase family 3 C-terminal domain-containing protein, partial [Verrucomicrobiota bacterium]